MLPRRRNCSQGSAENKPVKSCPQCGTPTQGGKPGLPLVTCGTCDALLLVKGDRIENVGDSGTMPFDVSPLQLGTILSVDGARGEIVGRERWAWERGSWNEWLLDFGGERHAWVAEEAGFYMVMGPIKPRADVARRLATLGDSGKNALGESVQLDNKHYVVSDIKEIRCVASEGHLPEAVPTKFQRRSLDLRNKSGGVVTWQSDPNRTGVWIGRYYSLAELAPARLRRFDGWSLPNYASAS